MAAIHKLPSGNWRVQVRKAGATKTATFPLKREADAWAATQESQASQRKDSGRAEPDPKSTVADMIRLYREAMHAVGKKWGKTKDATLDMLARELGEVRLVKLNEVTLRKFVTMRVKQGAGGVTIAADLSFFSSVLRWARNGADDPININAQMALDVRDSLEAKGLKVRSKERSREPSDDELARLYAHWQANPRQVIDMTTICRFALATAMRLGEICGIKIEDVKRDIREVIIRDRKDPEEKEGNDQQVPLLDEAWEIVEPLINDRTKGAIFQVNGASVSTAFTRACAALEIEDLRFHDLRHRGTTELFRLGLDIPRVSLMTGHKDWNMLKRYTKVTGTDVREMLEQAKDLKVQIASLKAQKQALIAGVQT